MLVDDLITELPIEIRDLPSARQALDEGVPAAEILYCLTASKEADPCVYWKIVTTGFPRGTAARVAAESLSFPEFQDTQEAGVAAEEFDTVLSTQDAYFRGYLIARIDGANPEEAMELALRHEGWNNLSYKQLRASGVPHSEALAVASGRYTPVPVYLNARATKSHAEALQIAEDFIR